MKNKILLLVFWLAIGTQAMAQNNCLSFDGSDDYVQGSSINPSTFTVSAWFNSSDLTDSHTIISLQSDINFTGFSFRTNGPQLEACISNSGVWITPVMQAALTANTWYHIAATFYGGTLTLYLNGSQVATLSSISYIPGTEPLRIGRNSDNTGLFGKCYFKGMIDEVAIWNRNLSSSEIADMMLNGINDPAQTNLMAHYGFNQGTANGNNSGITTLNDISGNSRNATLYSFSLNGNTSNWIRSYDFLVLPSSVRLAKAANSTGSAVIIFSTPSSSWTATTDQSWLTLSSTNGTGSSSLTLTANSENQGELTRIANVTVSSSGYPDQTIQVKQTGSTILTANCTAGGLKTAITDADKEVVTKLTLTGTIDARDFKIMRDNMPALKEIDLSGVTIAAYSGGGGTDLFIADYPKQGIPQYAFYNLVTKKPKSISGFVFPASATSIEEYAFFSCSTLTGGLSLPSALKHIGTNAFYGCSSLTGNLAIPESVTSIEKYAFAECSGFNGTLTLPSTLTSIEPSTFYNCKGLIGNLSIPTTVATIGISAFENCKGFTGNLIIPEAVTLIDAYAFSGCSGLNGTLTLPPTLKYIKEGAFLNCSGLTGNLSIPSSVDTIKQYSFSGCSSFSGDLIIPQAVKSIEKAAFANCKGFNNKLSIPETVTAIGESAFSSCTGLASIYVSWDTPLDLSSSPNVFSGVNKTTCKLYIPYGTYDLYSNANQWKDFLNILEENSGFRVGATSVTLDAVALSSATVDVRANVSWTASGDQSWLNVAQSTTAAANGTITLTATTENTWKPRTANVTVSSPGYTSRVIKVTQNSSTYQGDPPAIPLSPNMDATTPIADQNEFSVIAAYNNTRYFRFKPTTSGTYTFTSQSDTYNTKGILYDNSGKELSEAYDNFICNGNSHNFAFSYNLTAGQIYYFGVCSYSSGNSPIIPLKITGGDLESFTWRNNDNSGKWSPTANWSWGNTSGIVPNIWNGATIEGALSLDQCVTIIKLTIPATSSVSNATSKMLYSYYSIINKGTITNNGSIFVGNSLMNYGFIANNGFIYGPVFAPIVFEENGGTDVPDIMPQYGTTLSLPTPTKASYDFAGWYTDQDLKVAFTATIMPLNGFKLYAKWIALPKVTTQAATNITSGTATGNGTITFLGAPNPTQYGVVWSTSHNPTIALSTRTEQGAASSTGTFTSSITGLTQNTTYYVRAYSTNEIGTVYGDEVEFTTKAIPVISWDDPADITYGTKLSSAQLNATAKFNGSDIDGTFTYTPTSGEILNAGTGQILSVEFKPTNEERYETVNKTVLINVAKATPIITWDNPANIMYETLLSETQLNAKASNNSEEVEGTYEYTPKLGDKLDAGEHTLSVAFTPSNLNNYNIPAIQTAKIVVEKATTVITWSDPANITYGTILDNTQLNAAASFNNAKVDGTYEYSPKINTKLDAGVYTLAVAFKPTDDKNYNAASKTVQLKVDKASPVITWNSPENIVYGTILDNTQLNASANFNNNEVVGTFDYSPKGGDKLNAGSHTLSVVFTPSDAANYNSVNKSVLLNVDKASPAITWNNPASIVYGTVLDNTQLNASANFNNAEVIGTFDYSPKSGDKLDAGDHSLSVVFNPTDADNYNSVSKTVQLNIDKASPVITWNSPATIIYGTVLDNTQLNASANFNNTEVIGTFDYSPKSGEKLDAGTHTLSVAFKPTDEKNYNIPSTKTVQITVEKATPLITWNNPAGIVYGTILDNTQLNASVNFNNDEVLGTFDYSPKAGDKLNAGPHTLTVVFTPTDGKNYNSVSNSVQLNVDKASPIIKWDNPTTIVYGAILDNTQLNASANFNNAEVIGTYNYSPKGGDKLNAGPHTLSVVFTPTDAENYNSISKTVQLNVDKASPIISWSTPENIVYGTILDNTQLTASANFNSAEVIGTFDYTPKDGDKLNAGPHTLSVVFTPADAENYNSVSKSVQLNVDKASPVITWNTPANIVYGTILDNIQLNASAVFNNSKVIGTLDYSPKSGDKLDAGDHTLSVAFTPSDVENYNSASKTVQLSVDKVKLSIGNPSVVKAKLYDGNTTANINAIGQLSGVVSSDLANVSVNASANYDNAAIGSNKTIRVVYTLVGSAISNYIVPNNYLINDGSISEMIALKSLLAPQAGCEGGKLSLSYTTQSGAPAEYQLTFNEKALSAGFSNTSYAALPPNAVLIDVPAHLADGTYSGSIQMRDQYGIASELFPFQFTIDVTADIIIPKFGNVVLVDNHTNRFTAYQWYKDGSPITGATKQFYKDPNGFSGTYNVQVKTTTGETLNTCSKTLNIQKTTSAELSVYPNPVRSGQDFSVKITGLGDEELKGAVMIVYNLQGMPIFTSRKVIQDNRINLSEVDGVYMGRITTVNGENLTFKIIMTN
jgi:Listeria/Bacterioides repeat